jgi:Skp family chaperone for outer membrane proteins
MNSRTIVWAGTVLGAALMMAWARPAAADDAVPATSVKIAVCNPIKVLNEIQEGKDAMSRWKQFGDQLTDQAKAKKDQLQNEQDELKLILPTSDDYEKKVEKFTEDQVDSQAWLQAKQVNFARQQRMEEKQLFDKIMKTISDLAQAQGISVVMNGSNAEFPEIDKMDANAFVQTILMHTTLYSDTKLDITQQVIIAMDKAYSSSGSGAGGSSGGSTTGGGTDNTAK